MSGLPGSNFPGGIPPSAGGFGGFGGFGGADEDPAKLMAKMMESCFGKSAVAGVMGFGMGGLFGMFMASMSYDTPYAGPGASPAMQSLSSLPLRKQLAAGFKDMGSRAWLTGKNFGQIGALYAGIECGIEGFRAKNDLPGAIAAGCITGGIIARRTGPVGVLAGMVGFGAFSAAIEVYMRQPGED